MRRVILVALSVMTTIVAVSAGCNRRVFVEVPPTCDGTIENAQEIPAEKAADILIVIDNSASMQEEQDRLAAAFINTTANCPIPSAALKDFARCDEVPAPDVCRFANPSKTLLDTPGPDGLADCGFIQVLAAFENDFRIGVITTDVGLCDNRIPGSQAALCLSNGTCADTGAPCGVGNACDQTAWGFRPQRGCLQPNGPPGTLSKVISRQDLLDGDAGNDDIGQRFIDTLKNVKVFGTPIERGLDAVELFLDPETPRDDSCAGDKDSFIRDDAKLVVIFLTDEEDCSRDSSVGACTDENCSTCDDPNGCGLFVCPAGVSCESAFVEFRGETCGLFDEHFRQAAAKTCYDLEDKLTPVQHYVDVLKSQKANQNDVSVAVIAGGLAGADGKIAAAGCKFDAGNGQPVGGCVNSFGTSNTCAADANCCFADPGGRYFELADGMGDLNGLKDTICVDSFSQTMVKIAVFIADVESLKLAEEPADINLVVVEKADAGSTEFSVVDRIPDVKVCPDGANGWVLEEGNKSVRFCGSAKPLPGEQVRVRAKGEGANEGGGPDACEGRGTLRPAP